MYQIRVYTLGTRGPWKQDRMPGPVKLGDIETFYEGCAFAEILAEDYAKFLGYTAYARHEPYENGWTLMTDNGTRIWYHVEIQPERK